MRQRRNNAARDWLIRSALLEKQQQHTFKLLNTLACLNTRALTGFVDGCNATKMPARVDFTVLSA